MLVCKIRRDEIQDLGVHLHLGKVDRRYAELLAVEPCQLVLVDQPERDQAHSEMGAGFPLLRHCLLDGLQREQPLLEQALRNFPLGRGHVLRVERLGLERHSRFASFTRATSIQRPNARHRTAGFSRSMPFMEPPSARFVSRLRASPTGGHGPADLGLDGQKVSTAREADPIAQPLEETRADPGHPQERFGGREEPVGLTTLYDSSGESRTDTRQRS